MSNDRERSGRNDDVRRRRGNVGEGMNSPDSTEVPLRADTGRPDERVEQGAQDRSIRERSDLG